LPPVGSVSVARRLGRHRYGVNRRHYAFYGGAVHVNNPGGYVESRVGTPATNVPQFDQDARDGINARYSSIASATAIEPFPVNFSESGAFLGNINYLPYTTCN
jgi:hypothetical protein